MFLLSKYFFGLTQGRWKTKRTSAIADKNKNYIRNYLGSEAMLYGGADTDNACIWSQGVYGAARNYLLGKGNPASEW